MAADGVVERVWLQHYVDMSFDNMIDPCIVVTKELYVSHLFTLLTSQETGLQHTPIAPGTSWNECDDHLGWIILSTLEMLNTAARIIGAFHGLEPVTIKRAIMMQNAFMTAGEWEWFCVNQDSVNVEIVRTHIIADPPVSKQECSMHTHMYGYQNMASIVACAMASPAA